MRLLRHAANCIVLQIGLAYLLKEFFDVGYVWFALWMAVAAHIVVEITAISPHARNTGFKMFMLTYLVAEVYLFAAAFLGAIYEFGFTLVFPLTSLLYNHGANIMFCLTVLSLVTDSFTIILRNCGAAGDTIRTIIDRLYSAAMRLPIHQNRG